jgi:deoxyribodipyrimidine photolyase-related protein
MQATLIYPHQLFAKHPALSKGTPVFLIEDPLFFGNDPHWPLSMHGQKLVLHRAAMQAYAAELTASGHEVTVIEAPQGSETDSADLLGHIFSIAPTKLHLADPADEILLRRIQRYATQHQAELVIHPSPNFLTPPELLEKFCSGPKKSSMARFYEAQRKRLGLLLEDDGSPIGGKWSFDTENRERLPSGHPLPDEPHTAQDAHVREAIDYVSRRFAGHLGSLEKFRWPVTRAGAEEWYQRFLDERFSSFGDYEDAITTRHAFLFHSAITPMLNIGLLDPQSVLDRALSHALRHQVPMNSLEGFIRQVIGWREFMHGLYQHRGATVRTGNFWHFTRPMPQGFYDGTTGIPPIDRVIRQLLDEGWCHHIERLMILGNFMLLCRIRPDDVYRWFMELFVDAYDWVMVPNVYGMSQFADGGTFTTKPYLSGSNYVRKMSDEPKGDWCAIWDALFWIFIADHRDFFLKNPRLSMMARTWEKMSPEKQEQHRQTAEKFLTEA